MCVLCFNAGIHLGASSKRLLKIKESKEADKAAPKINSGATDGGYFSGKPMESESGQIGRASCRERVCQYV